MIIYSNEINILCETAWNHYKLGLIPNARKLPTETLIKQLSKENDYT